MLDGRKLIIDTFSEVYPLLKPWADGEFWDLREHEPVVNSIYVIGRKQFFDNRELIIDNFICRSDITVMFDNAAEGSATLSQQLKLLGLDDFARNGQLLLLSGGDMESDYTFMHYDHFLVQIMRYDENIQAQQSTDDIFRKVDKPYSFLFLNGRARPHRKYLYERFKRLNLLDNALWTMLDNNPVANKYLTFLENGHNVMMDFSEYKWLDPHYEFALYANSEFQPSGNNRFVKYELFNNQWGEIYLNAPAYVDTYFSLVTETVFEHPYSFRTEKIAKPLMIGHPWICATSMGFYRDMHNLGFKTFGNLIDESFDTIENHQDRMDRIIDVVQEVCNNTKSFLAAAEDTCKFNQQHLQELVPQIQSEFPGKFFKFIEQHG